MKQNLRVSLGAVILALATLAAVIYAWINFRQRETFEMPDDGVAWLDTSHGAQAWKLAPNSPASRAGVRPGDVLISINGARVDTQVQVTKRLWRAGLAPDYPVALCPSRTASSLVSNGMHWVIIPAHSKS